MECLPCKVALMTIFEQSNIAIVHFPAPTPIVTIYFSPYANREKTLFEHPLQTKSIWNLQPETQIGLFNFHSWKQEDPAHAVNHVDIITLDIRRSLITRVTRTHICRLLEFHCISCVGLNDILIQSIHYILSIVSHPPKLIPPYIGWMDLDSPTIHEYLFTPNRVINYIT